MDNANKQNTTTTNGAAGTSSGASSAGAFGMAGGTSSLSSLPGMKAEVAAWVQFMRRPGMVMSMDIQKRHVCDMDTEVACGVQGGAAQCGCSSQSNGSSQADSTSDNMQDGDATCSCGGTLGQPGVMCYREVCRVRYFDLAVGAMAVLLVGGMMRVLCGCMKKMW